MASSNRTLLLLFVIISSRTTRATKIVVTTTNELGKGRLLTINCTLDLEKDMGTHRIPVGGSVQWKFTQNKPILQGDLLECDVRATGVFNVLMFASYHMTSDSCTSNCAWRFTDGGLLHLVDGQWKPYASWLN